MFKVEDQFKLSQLVALAIKKYLDTLAVGKVEVKWPNDILINGKKVAGVLIQNVIQGNCLTASVVGVGLNVNETDFPNFARPATSLRLMSEKEYDLNQVLNGVLDTINEFYSLAKKGNVDLHKMYQDSLYQYGVPSPYQDAENEFMGVIVGVAPNGFLQVNKRGKLKQYELKELKFLS